MSFDSKPARQLEPGSELLLGWSTVKDRQTFGFASQSRATTQRLPPRQLVRYQGEAHAVTFAPTGTGKTTGVVVPNLLHYSGSVVVVDVKAGELTRITARRRREMGQQVIVLDPFQVTDEATAGLCPLEMFSLPGCDLESDAEMLSSLFGHGYQGVKDPFWDQHGMALLAAIIAHVAALPIEERRLSKVFDMLLADDTVYSLAVLLDTVGKDLPKMAYREIAAFLQMPDITRGGVLSTALSYLKTLQSPGVLQSLDETTFSLPDFIDGRPMSIYLVLPPDKLQSHRAILKLWIGALLKGVVSRTHRPERRTLLLIDECGQLGHFPFLETFITLCRGYSCSVWTCFQDLAQLQSSYPYTWKTLLNNCGVIQAFGFTNGHLASQWSEYLEATPRELRALPAGESIVAVAGQQDAQLQRMNYLRDPEFAGQFDANPLYQPGARAFLSVVDFLRWSSVVTPGFDDAFEHVRLDVQFGPRPPAHVNRQLLLAVGPRNQSLEILTQPLRQPRRLFASLAQVRSHLHDVIWIAVAVAGSLRRFRVVVRMDNDP